MLKELIERFKRVFTVKDWKLEAQDAMRRKEFVIEALNELHRVEKAEAAAGQDRVISRNQRSQTMGYGAQQTQVSPQVSGSFAAADYNRHSEKKRTDLTLADLMNSIKLQQVK